MEKLYKTITAEVCQGKKRLTQDDLMEMIGWTTDKKKAKQAKISEPFITLEEGSEKTEVYCLNNTKNRPFSEAWAKQLGQDILNRNWADSCNSEYQGEELTLNGESIIIDWFGEVQSGQHRIMGAIFAEFERTKGAYAKHWQKIWPNPITLEAIVVRGISPSSKVTRTLDNVKPRTYSDVLFLDPKFMPKANKVKREQIAKMCDFAVRMLWLRTGQNSDPFTPKRTHSEGLDFLDRHKRIKDAVVHIDAQNVAVPKSKAAVARYMNPGFAAALLYLMGTSASDYDKYYDSKEPSEKVLDFEHWEKACEFWTKLAENHPDLKVVREELANLADMNTVGDGTVAEKMGIIIKAWNLYVAGKKFRRDMLELEYKETASGERRLDDYPKVGGIDKGDTSVQKQKQTDDDSPTPEEIKDRAEKEKQKKLKKMRGEEAADEAARKKRKARDDEDEDDEEEELDDEGDEDDDYDDVEEMEDDDEEDEDFDASDDDDADEDEEDEDIEETEEDDSDEDEEDEEDDEPVARRRVFKSNGKNDKGGKKLKPIKRK